MDDELKAILPNDEEVSAQPAGRRFYGTSMVSLEVAFAHGIPLKGHDRRLLEHIRGNEESAFRGTTALPVINHAMWQGALYWADEGGWVYEIVPAMGWDPGQLLEGQVSMLGVFWNAPHATEGEVSIPSRIEPCWIYQGSLVKQKGDRLVIDKWILNPNYFPTR